MNKNFYLLISVVLIAAAGFGYRAVFLKDVICKPGQGEDVTIQIRSVEDGWSYDPAGIRINKCDRVTLNIFNEDEYDHGFAIDVFGVNQRIDPRQTTVIKFTASKVGEFVSYCSVPCGEGHFSHVGTVSIVEVVEE